MLHKPIIKILTWYALKKGRTEKSYPQTWNLMPRRWVTMKNKYPNGQNMLRRAKLRLVLEWLCDLLIGHEISNTERGHGIKKGYIDCNCRWCDKHLEVPIQETNNKWMADFIEKSPSGTDNLQV